MANYDVFNGDADGICALQQLRLQWPKESIRISGLKRQIDLLKQVEAQVGDEIVVLDISLDKNRDSLQTVLAAGAAVFYADHHFPGELPTHENLDLHIDPTADICTSLIINEYLGGAQAHWAVVGAFGDNFDAVATKLGESIGLDATTLVEYQLLGICLNYNGYGFELEDLMYHPADLFGLVSQYQNPTDFIQKESGYETLRQQYQTDMVLSENLKSASQTDTAAVYLLPNESWAKRIVGVMGNDLAKQNPVRAHALLVDMGDGYFRVSVRAPYSTKSGADEFCRQFESGGGRKAAAGINRLSESMLDEFTKRFNQVFEGIA
ncbi:MAG: acetyltransferase [Gammaproteobacteria bacterium]|nr:acetyltransferase [Gammaproteobacteria bacterium]